MNFEFIDLSLDDRQFKGETHNKNLEDAMKQAIVNFCKSMDTGLFLLDMPTGFGKTYSVLDFMVDNYDAPEFKDKKIFFVTTLKKNLPDKELREHFARRGKADDYDKYCLRIEANADMVVQKLDELYRARKIPPTITMKQEFKDLHGSVKLLNEYRDKKRELKGNSKDIINVLCKSAEDAIRKQQEGAFRKVIESELKQFRTPKEKLKNIANNPDYHWIGELYPAVYTREKRIFFMSMDKFFLGNTTIIEPTYSFYNNDITKNAIIFIDEFDATRDRLLNQIITRGLENHIDYLGLFHRVYASLKTRDFPAELTTASKLQQAYLDEHKNAKNPMEIIEGFGGVFDETYDRFAMQYSFKTEEDGKGDRSRNFIFNDLQFHSVFEGENAFIDIDTDMKAKQNWLCFTKRRPAEKDGGVLSLLASVKGCLTYFQNGARNLSFNYKHHKDEDKRPGDDDYTFENAIESVLTEFHLSREQIRYLKPIVMGGQVKSKKDKKDSNGKMSLKYFDRSVYNRGFRYYDFIDDPNHSMRSEIQLFDFQDSPERILLHLSEKAQIIGISATATLDTVIGNYDLEYLQRMLQDKFYVIYLEKPTNLLVNVDSKKGIEAENLIRFVYQMEFLMERGEVSRKDGIAVIKDAFICFSGGYTFSGKKGEPYKTDSVNNYALRTLIQAVGRICRIGLKNPDIYIYVDNTILTDYDLSIVEQRMLNPEFAELVKVGKIYYNGQANENLDIAVMENRAGTLALKAMQIINELKRNWTDDSIDYWKALRELCLMRPTLSRKNVEQNSQYQLVYMCAPGEITAYSYEQEGDYNKNINIKFDGSLPQKMSEDEVHLKEIMQIPGVKALFEKHGYATSFVPNEFILTPPMFNNIYKGALGEVVGKYILEQYAGVTLQEMPPEFFELFDYTLGNGVYVDFKLWKETMLISAEEEKKSVLEKLDKCGGKRTVIINIMLDHNMQITSSDSGRIIEIPYLYRLDRKEIGTEIIAKINREGYLQ